MITHKDLQDIIKSQMKNKGITLQQIADRSGYTRQAISFSLQTDRITYDKLFELAVVVGLTIEIRFN